MKKLLLFFLISIFFGCSNDEVTSEFNLTTYYFSNTIRHDEIRIFNSSGSLNLNSEQLFEQLVNEGYFSNLNSKFYISNPETTLAESEKENISFNRTYAIINSEDSVLVTLQGSLIRLKETDTAKFIVDFNTELIESMGKYQPEFSKCCIPISNTAGFQELKSIIPEIYGLVEGERLIIPRLDFVFYGNGIRWSGAILNELNSNVFTFLRNSDTLIVQQNWIVFED